SFDMKYGDIQALWGLRFVVEAGAAEDKTFTVLGNAEEEVGSPTSRPIIERLAREAECVFVLEPSVGAEGAIKLWRKGGGMYPLDVEGGEGGREVPPRGGGGGEPRGGRSGEGAQRRPRAGAPGRRPAQAERSGPR